jgi:uncharacterized small protein (DUF1192 family)
MDPEELEPRKKVVERPNLEPMSVAELEGYIASLEAEIARARSAIAAKKDVRAGAEALFKK